MDNINNTPKSQAVISSIHSEISTQDIQKLIINLPNRPAAMLAKDLADIYETDVRSINQAVKRNIERFPADFMFQATKEELEGLLNEAIDNEDYESASKIRDELQKRTNS
jgi:formaldehyde-activating enzyme involved in methanogenesis